MFVQIGAIAALAAAAAAEPSRLVAERAASAHVSASGVSPNARPVGAWRIIRVADRNRTAPRNRTFDISIRSTARAMQVWSGISRTRDIQVLRNFRKAFGKVSPLLARLAKERIAELRIDAAELSASVAPRSATRRERRPFTCDGVTVHLANGVLECVSPGGGRSIKDCSLCPSLVVVPPLSRKANAQKSESAKEQNASRPQEALAAPFAVGRFPVTRREFGIFVKATGHRMPHRDCRVWTRDGQRVRQSGNWRSPGFDQSDNHPVVCVNWRDALAYVRWLSETVQRPYRLLTGREWTHAARAGTVSSFWWGHAASPARANYRTPSTLRLADVRATVPVDHYLPNAWGISGVHGQVWEWTQDCLTIATAENSAASNCGRARVQHRILRGGSWMSVAQDIRIKSRLVRPSDWRDNRFGFRVARPLTP